MNSLRRWLYRPKRSDPSLLAQFYFADEELNLIAAELDGFEGRKDPERCAALVNQLRACQARVLNIVSQMMDESIKDQRALRDFRVKFPDDVIQENLAGQLWFGAECLAAGSSIMNREVESACMRPLARALTKNLDSLRTILREQCLRNVEEYTDVIKENLVIFDKLFAEFELSYVSAMVSVKTAHEYDMIQEITVLFSETVQRALKMGLLTQEMIDEYDPALMFTIPRLAIICGVIIFKDGPLNPDNDPWNITEMFRPFQTLLLKIRELLGILTAEELNTLERALCSQDEPSFLLSLEEKRKQVREERRKQKKERKGTERAKNQKKVSDGDNGSVDSELTAKEIAERLEALALNFEASHNRERMEEGNKGGELSVNGIDSNSEELPAQNGDDSYIQNGHNAIVQRLAVDLGCVEDLYREANLDSSEMLSVPSAFPGQDLLIQGIQMPTPFMNNGPHDQSHADSQSLSSLTNEPHETSESEVLNERDRFSLNKCDSRDSGLQSEVVSNSGSMFTISSSDSNQQILSSDSIPTPSDQNCTDSSEDVDPHDISTDVNGSLHTHLENSSDSSATIVSVIAANEDMKALKSEMAADIENPYCDKSEGEKCQETTVTAEKGEGFVDPGSDIQDSGILETSEGASADVVQSDVISVDNVIVVNAEVLVIAQQSDSLAENILCENSNQPETCDKSKVESENGNNELEEEAISVESNSVSDDTVKGIHSGDDAIKHSNIKTVENGITSENTLCDMQGDCGNEESNSSSLNPVSSVQSNNVDPSPQIPTPSLSSSSTNVIENGVSPNQNINPSANSIGDTETNHSTSTQQDTPHSSKAGVERNTANSSRTTPVNNVKKEKSASNTKAKVNSKRSKNPERRTRRQELGSYRSREPKTMLCAHHAKMLLEAHQQLENEHCHSSDTSSYTSECGDQEEIALAIEAAESATRNHVRARFRSSSDMIHRLFVCISGVADQLQTNFAGDLRNILRCVFDMNCPEPMDMCESEKPKDATPLGAAYRAMSHASRTPRHRHSSLRRDPPAWLPDEQSNDCMACQVPFNFLRRRHHCRNCGKIFCSRCSSNFVPLPHFGQEKAVRVCNRCFMFQVTPFTTE